MFNLFLLVFHCLFLTLTWHFVSLINYKAILKREMDNLQFYYLIADWDLWVHGKMKSWKVETMCRNLSCCGFLPVMLTASDWWLLSVAGLRLWLRSLLLAHFLLTSQQLTQSISVLLNPFGSRDAPAKRIILKQIRATAWGGHLKTVFIIKADRSSDRGVGLNFRSSDRSYCGGLWDSLVKSGVMLSHGSFNSQVWVENISTPFAGNWRILENPKASRA